ncbi:P-loop containing nucleoside triphosphate hydrolase protein [Globomyces pollinis-pini]|nr:P-loop containing nucleoside triphosphate hydrolase protein [Globomyces pollinis-pini]
MRYQLAKLISQRAAFGGYSRSLFHSQNVAFSNSNSLAEDAIKLDYNNSHIASLPSITSKSLLDSRQVLGKGTSFVDSCSLIIQGGKGGDGEITFDKIPPRTVGPPSGGNGGRGGDVYVVASKNVTSLNQVKKVYAVQGGQNGKSKRQHGANGANTIIYVPVGTIIRQVPLPEYKEFTPSIYEDAEMNALSKYYKFRRNYIPQKDRIKMLWDRVEVRKNSGIMMEIDLIKDGQKHLVFRGGQGGFGNPHFQTPLIAGPGIAGRGEVVPPVKLELELKTLADVGLVGLPNAGKSTLLKAVSNAHPKIAPYPFTTLNPYIGTIDFPDFWTMTIADMPGIISGAHQNQGLGLRFLRHIERNKIFVYVIDLASPNPWDDLKILQDELESYKVGLTLRPSIVAANKADVSDIAKENLMILREKTSMPIVPISAKYDKNVTTLTSLMRTLVTNITEEPNQSI